MTTQHSRRTYKVRRQAVASRYSMGTHSTDPNGIGGEPSIRESFSLFHFMLAELFAKGVRPGDRLTVVIQKQGRVKKTTGG